MRLYLIGAVTGKPNDNRGTFEAVRSELLRAGYQCDIPHDFIEKGEARSTAMLISINNMTRYSHSFLRRGFHSDYDAVAMLEGWEESKGARLEHDICEAIGMPCKPWREYLNEL